MAMSSPASTSTSASTSASPGSPARQGLPSSARLKVRLTLMTLLLVALLTSLSSLLVRNMSASVTPALRDDLRWKAQRGVVELSYSADFGVLTANQQQLSEAAAQYTRDPDVAYLRFRDAQQQVLLEHGAASGLPPLQETPEAVVESHRAFLAWAPVVIEGLRVGDVTLAVSKRRLQAGTQLYRRMLLLGGLGALIALAMALLFVRRYVTPILRLTEQTSRELELAARAALASAEAKSRFLANMSHEIRTPMNGMFGMLHLVQQTALDSRQRRYLDVISSSARSLLKVVNDILDLSKLNAHGYQLLAEPCSPRHLVDETLLLLSQRARDKSLELSAEIDPSTPAGVLLDGDRFRQVLSNLLGNAIKFTEQGSVQVSVRARAEAGVQRLEVAVSDTGPGIPESAQPRLFQAFSQVDESSRRAHEGTGLGLAICKQLIELMGGQIGYRRREEGGSSFFFSLPVQSCALPGSSAVSATTPPEAPASAAPLYAGKPLLLVDDNEVNQIVAVEVLEQLGFSVDVAASGQDAIDAALSKEYALILMDCQMPGMDGYEATRELRRRQAGRRVPIVAFTAHALPEEREKVLRSGMDDILLKPIEPAELTALLARHLGAPSAGGEQRSPSSGPRQRLSGPAAPGTANVATALVDESEPVLAAGVRRPPRAVASFLRQTPAEIDSLLAAVREARSDDVRRIAHKLKGSAASLGAPELTRRCEELQDRAHEASHEQLVLLTRSIEQAYQRARAALEQHPPEVNTA